MYLYCEEHDLREVWAYLWVNWYRPERWPFWARSVCAVVPLLKHTMVCETL